MRSLAADSVVKRAMKALGTFCLGSYCGYCLESILGLQLRCWKSTLRDLNVATSPNRSRTRRTSLCSGKDLGVGNSFMWTVLAVKAREDAMLANCGETCYRGIIIPAC